MQGALIAIVLALCSVALGCASEKTESSSLPPTQETIVGEWRIDRPTLEFPDHPGTRIIEINVTSDGTLVILAQCIDDRDQRTFGIVAQGRLDVEALPKWSAVVTRNDSLCFRENQDLIDNRELIDLISAINESDSASVSEDRVYIMTPDQRTIAMKRITDLGLL